MSNQYTLEELREFKSAVSLIHNKCVDITNVRTDGSGEPIFDCLVPQAYQDKPYLFRLSELTNFNKEREC